MPQGRVGVRVSRPDILKPEQASVLDPWYIKAIRKFGTLAQIAGLDDPTVMTEIAMGAPLMAAGKRAASALLKTGRGTLDELSGTPSIRAYHGSPHDFEKFSLEKIGSGEGVQAYGHGLYFAEAEDVARSYQKELTRRPITIAGDAPLSREQKHILKYLSDRNIPIDDETVLSVGDAMTSAPFNIGPRTRQTWDKWKSAWDELKPRLSQVEKPGRTYEVAIKADPDEFLDWDKPLSEQSEKVKQALKDAVRSDAILGERLSHATRNEWSAADLFQRGEGTLTMTAPEVSERLRQLGVKGIRYLDMNSRGTAGATLQGIEKTADGYRARMLVRNRGGSVGSAPTDIFTKSKPFSTEAEAAAWASDQISGGTRNYVVFDDAIIDIRKKYGVALPVAAALARGQYRKADQER